MQLISSCAEHVRYLCLKKGIWDIQFLEMLSSRVGAGVEVGYGEAVFLLFCDECGEDDAAAAE